MLEALLQRLRIHSAARRREQEEAWDIELNDIRMQMLACKAAAEMEMQAYMDAKQAELAQIAESMSEMDYMEAMADSFSGGPGAVGDQGEGNSEGEAE